MPLALPVQAAHPGLLLVVRPPCPNAFTDHFSLLIITLARVMVCPHTTKALDEQRLRVQVLEAECRSLRRKADEQREVLSECSSSAAT